MGGVPTRPYLIVYPHMPKTGGSSLERNLKTALGERYFRMGRFKPDRRPRDLPDDLSGIEVLSGNIDFAQAEALFPMMCGEVRYVGFVRDPVERLQSFYAHTRAGSATAAERSTRLRAAYDDSFDVVARRWLAAPETITTFTQCRRIGGDGCEGAVELIERRYLAVATTRSVNRLARAITGADVGEAHIRPSRSAEFAPTPETAEALRELLREDDRLHRWVCDNEDRLLAAFDARAQAAGA